MSTEHNWFHRMRRGEAAPAPIAGLLGEAITRVDLAAGELEATFQADGRFLNPAATVQGGMLGAMLDALTASLVDATLAPNETVATASLNLSFLRPAQAGALQGGARMVRRGKTVCHVQGELRQDGKLVATATAVCTIHRTVAR